MKNGIFIYNFNEKELKYINNYLMKFTEFVSKLDPERDSPDSVKKTLTKKTTQMIEHNESSKDISIQEKKRQFNL